MLVLSRKSGESIILGNDIVVTVQRVKGDRVSLVIDAPKHIVVDRGEIRIKKDEAKSSE